MNRDALLTVAVAACCVLAIGSAATTMESAVDTTPDEAVDLSYRSIPLDGDTADRLKRQAQGGEESGQSQAAPSDSGQRSDSVLESSDGSSEQEPSGSSDTDRDGAGDANAGGRTGRSGTGQGPAQRAAGLLWTLLDALLVVLPILAALVALAVAVRYRERLLAAARALLGRFGRQGGDSTPATGAPDREPAPPSPQNDVARAWFVMADRLGLSDRASTTPRECVEAARNAGVDPDPVERLTRHFEQVRYGGAAVTDRRRSRSNRALREVLDQLPEGRVR